MKTIFFLIAVAIVLYIGANLYKAWENILTSQKTMHEIRLSNLNIYE